MIFCNEVPVGDQFVYTSNTANLMPYLYLSCFFSFDNTLTLIGLCFINLKESILL